MAKKNVYITIDGDIVDQIVHTHYGYVDNAIEGVLNANPHLWEMPERLPSGVEIILPKMQTNKKDRMVRLWDKA